MQQRRGLRCEVMGSEAEEGCKLSLVAGLRSEGLGRTSGSKFRSDGLMGKIWSLL